MLLNERKSAGFGGRLNGCLLLVQATATTVAVVGERGPGRRCFRAAIDVRRADCEMRSDLGTEGDGLIHNYLAIFLCDVESLSISGRAFGGARF